MKTREIMRAKVPTATPDESAASAWERMRALDVDHLVVTREREIVGIISWYDLMGPEGGGRRRMGRRVGDLMNRNVLTAGPGTSLARVATLMCRRRVGCVPIVTRHDLVGVVTTSDMLGVLARGGKNAGGSRR
jgi:predicted transcriptional regulator